MLKSLSRRLGRVVLEARREAGKRGANSIDVNSLVAGLIIEDQEPNSMDVDEQDPAVRKYREMEPKPLTLMLRPGGGIKRDAFFSAGVAAGLLAKLNDALPKSASVPDNTPILTSPEFDRVFHAADDLRRELQQSNVETLDLLAAAFKEPCEATRLLVGAGITEEKVLQTIHAGGDLEKGSRSRNP